MKASLSQFWNEGKKNVNTKLANLKKIFYFLKKKPPKIIKWIWNLLCGASIKLKKLWLYFATHISAAFKMLNMFSF